MRDQLPLNALSTDPISEAMEGIGLRSWVPGRFELSEPWGLKLRGDLGWCYLLISGQCCVEMEGCDASAAISPGDLVVVPQGRAHRLRDRNDSQPVGLATLLRRWHFENQEALVHGGGGDQTRLACICFLLDDQSRSPLLACLPALMAVRGERGEPLAYVDHIFRLITNEAASGQPCAQAIINRLVRILLIRTVYRHAAQLPANEAGWLKALLDPGIGQALALMHRKPEVSWTVASLADEVAMSRSAFSAKFGAMLGKPPLEYLTEWRMQRACVLLTTTHSGLKEIASQVGYDSPAAFSKAFARWAGTAPTAYRTRVRTASRYSRVPPVVA